MNQEQAHQASSQPMNQAPPRPARAVRGVIHARVIDVDMPFMSMVAFMIKWALASIPAFIILFVLGAMFASCAGLTMRGLF